MGWSNKILTLVISLVLLAVVGAMSILGTSGSITMYNVLRAIQDWSGLIALGVALGLFYYFMPQKKGGF